MLIYNLIEYRQMENKSVATGLSPSRSENVLKKYHQMTSPLVSLQSVKRQDLMKEELRQNVSMKLDCIKNRGSKIYALDSSISYTELKAGAALYQIPQFSTPEVNFEVSDQIRKKVEEAKKEIISYFPQISRSSNYAPKKIEHQLNHRSAVRQLEEWLNDKLKNPPINSEESIEYKNMIMGVGMKELIRIIGKRCSEQGRMAEEIWELTWSICRQIILYLSKRAKKCEQLLEEELLFMRSSYEKEFERLNTKNIDFTKRIETLEEENKEYLSELVKIRKRRQNLEDENKELTYDNSHLQNQFKKVLEENLAIYLQIGDKNKRGWIKKMYKNINSLPEDVEKTVKAIFKKEVIEVVEERVQLEEITGDCDDKIDAEEVELIGNREEQRDSKKKKKRKAKDHKNRNNRASKAQRFQENTLITAPAESNDCQSETESEASCADLIHKMRGEFLPIDAEMQTDQKLLIDAYASTHTPEFADQQMSVDAEKLGLLEEIGINTEEIKQEPTKLKKKGKENTKDEGRTKEKSKIYNSSPLKQKPKPKIEKDKKSILDIVQQLNLHEQSKTEEKDENSSVTNDITNLDNNMTHESKVDLNPADIRSFQKKNSIMANSEPIEPTFKTNSAILSPSYAQEIIEKMANSANEPSRQEKTDTLLKKLEQNIAPIVPPSKIFEKESNNSIYSQASKEKQVHSISFDTGLNRIKQIQEKTSKLQAINECNMYICAECNKIITAFDQKFENPKNKFTELEKCSILYEQKKSVRCSPYESIRKLSPDADGEDGDPFQKRSSGMRRVRKEVRKNSSYIHDIGFKKEMEEQQQQQQQQQQVFKSTFYNNSKDETYEKYEENEVAEVSTNVYNKMSPYLLFFTQLIEGNISHIQGIVNAPQQVAENLEHYFEMVREINNLPENKINISEKSTISIIEKNIFPILNELLVTVKKSVKANKIVEMMKNFTSLPNIIYNRITRKYGVKILAIKNLKILLMALKEAGKYTDKYKIIELMMFTDCKSPHSEDLFMYLFVMALFDPTFSSNRFINAQETQTVKKVCEDYLTKQPLVYQQFDKLSKQLVANKEQDTALLSNLVKSIITNYRLLKINRIQEIGFVYLMLKKDHYMSYKKFIYFLATLNIAHAKKTGIAKKLLEFCDIKNKDQKIGISELMFSKFLMNCEDFNFRFLEETVNLQLEHYKSQDKDIVEHLSSKFFKTQKFIKTKYDFDTNKDDLNKPEAEQQSFRESISILEINDTIILNPNNDSSLLPSENLKEVISNITVLQQIKEYSSFTFQICKYLQNSEQTKYLTFKQHLFIKNYLIIHIIQSEIERTVGLVDYFSNSMLEMVCMPLDEFSIAFDKTL